MAVKCHFTVSFKHFFLFPQGQHTVIAQNTDNALTSCSTNILVPWARPEGDTLAGREVSCLPSSAADLPYKQAQFNSSSQGESPHPAHLWQEAQRTKS